MKEVNLNPLCEVSTRGGAKDSTGCGAKDFTGCGGKDSPRAVNIVDHF